MPINYDDWINVPIWKAWEAVMLFTGLIVDENLFYAILRPTGDFRYGSQADVARIRKEVPHALEVFKKNAMVIERAINAGDLTEAAKFLPNAFDAEGEPHQFIKIAKKYKLLIPERLSSIEMVEGMVDVSEKDIVDKKLKPNQIDRELCRALAQLLWNENLLVSQKEKSEMKIDYEVSSTQELKISKMCKHPWLKKYGNASQYKESTIQNWIKDLAPDHSPGRPKKP